MNNLSRLQVCPVSHSLCVRMLLRKFYYLINILSLKKEVCMCNISMKRKMHRLHGGINEDKIT